MDVWTERVRILGWLLAAIWVLFGIIAAYFLILNHRIKKSSGPKLLRLLRGRAKADKTMAQIMTELNKMSLSLSKATKGMFLIWTKLIVVFASLWGVVKFVFPKAIVPDSIFIMPVLAFLPLPLIITMLKCHYDLKRRYLKEICEEGKRGRP